MEQALYLQEGITIPGTAFVDNQPTLDLLEAKATGVFSMVDEEINVPRGSDEGFLQKLLNKYADGKHPNLQRPNVKDVKDFLKNFGIVHYAGPVYYNVTNFLEKNKDQLHVDIVSLLRDSTSIFMKKMFPPVAADEANNRGGKGAASKLKTLGGQFKQQLNELIETLNSTFPHFVRCMKPNDEKLPNQFKAIRMQDQLRYAGLLEVCRIRKLGYPVRRPFEEFFRRYRCCDLVCPNLDALILSLTAKGVLTKGEWAKGNTRIFLRTQQAAELELARETALLQVVLLLQKMGRGMVARIRFKNFKKILATLAEAVKKRDEATLASALEMSFELPWGGVHLSLIQKAKLLLLRVKEENKVTSLLVSAVAAKELNSLKSAIAAAASMSPPFESPLLFEAKAVVERLEAELQAKEALNKAIASRDLNALATAIAKAESLGLVCNELQQASALKARIELENQCIAKLDAAVKSRNSKDLNIYISEAAELGISDSLPSVKAAHELRDVLNSEEKKNAERAAEEAAQKEAMEKAQTKRRDVLETARKQLVDAIASNDHEQLNAALQSAIEQGLSGDQPDVAQAQNMLKNKNQLEDLKSRLEASCGILKLKSETGITNDDLTPLANAIRASEEVCTSTMLQTKPLRHGIKYRTFLSSLYFPCNFYFAVCHRPFNLRNAGQSKS